jgi:YVTN family beta-propeller protein
LIMKLTGFFTSLVYAALLQGAVTPSPALLLLSKSELLLKIVDPVTLKVAGEVPSGPDPHEVIASADGRYAYISNYGGGAYNTITVVDLAARKALPAIDLGALRGPHGLVFEGGKLWFTAEGAKVIGSYDPAIQKVDWVLGTGQNRTHMLFVYPDMSRIVTSNVSSATMTIIEKGAGGVGGGRGGPPPPNGRGGRGPGGPPQQDWDETVVKVGNGAEGFDVSPDGKQIWAANAQDGTISIVDAAAKKVTETLDANVKGANRLKFTLDGRFVFVSSLNGPEVAIFDTATHKEVKRVPVGRGAAGILMEPGGARVFVACTPDNYLAAIDLKSMTITGRVAAGQPDGLAWAVRK